MTKFYHQGASGPEEWVLVPAEGMSTAAQVEAAAKAGYEERIRQQFGCEPGASYIAGSETHTIRWDDLPDNIKEKERIATRAALAAAQAVGAKKAADWVREADANYDEGFAAGIEAAAKWLETKGNPIYSAAIRALRPSAAPAEGEPTSSIEYHQRRGAAWDIIDEAIESYLQWMADDDYDAMPVLKSIINKMQERRQLYASPPSASAPAGAPDMLELKPGGVFSDNTFEGANINSWIISRFPVAPAGALSEELIAHVIAEKVNAPGDEIDEAARAVVALLQDGKK